MRLRTPPGRMGVMWLRERLAVASRAREVLEQKLEALTRERHDVRARLAADHAEWQRAIELAEQALGSAELIGGVDQTERVSALAAGATVEVAFGRTLGVSHPTAARVTPPPLTPTPWSDTSQLRWAAAAYREALSAGARYAATRRALDILEAENRRTTRRLRSIERRWMPALESQLRASARALDEAEREDSVRLSWVARRRGTAGGG